MVGWSISTDVGGVKVKLGFVFFFYVVIFVFCSILWLHTETTLTKVASVVAWLEMASGGSVSTTHSRVSLHTATTDALI